MANGTYYHDGEGWKPTHSRPPLRRPNGGGNGSNSGDNVELDTTLTVAGKAADAKAVGDALAPLLKFELRDIVEGDTYYIATSGTYGAILLSTKALTITEGGTGTFGVRLATAPETDQIVRLTADNADVTLSPTALTFTPDNWETEQTVTIMVTADEDADHDAATITASSSEVGSAELLLTISDVSGGETAAAHYEYVFNITTANTTINLDSNPNGDGITDWGDGTVDSETSHRYSAAGTYTVITDNTIGTKSGDYKTRPALTRVNAWSSALFADAAGVYDPISMFDGCTNLVHVADIPEGYTGLTKVFVLCTSLQTPPAIPESVTTMSGTFYNSGLTVPPVIPESVINLIQAFFGSKIKSAPVLHPAVTNVRLMCYGCTELIETHEPWNIEFTGSINSSQCFDGCTALDLTTVPTTWGGTMEV